MKTKSAAVFLAVAAATTLVARADDLPDPLLANDGSRITTVDQWREKRRPELLEFFRREMYGRSPAKPEHLTSKIVERDPQALGGKATRLQIAIFPGGDSTGPRLDLLLYIPNQVKTPPPVILGLNFDGNHTIHPDPAILINEVDAKNARGSRASQWPVEEILARGYALATMARENVASDRDTTLTTGLHALYPELQKGDDNFATIAAWAWGLSRALDVLEQQPAINAKRTAVFGFSRLGKAALWAGATDERFALTISNESGAGGAKLFRRGMGEDIARLNRVFPHWFARNFRKYDGQDTTLPFDQHLPIALLAPRPAYVASAIDDKHSDPEGEFLATRAANPVYQLYKLPGLPAKTWPAPNAPIQSGTLGYHVRPGIHDVTAYDWQQYLTFADRNLK